MQLVDFIRLSMVAAELEPYLLDLFPPGPDLLVLWFSLVLQLCNLVVQNKLKLLHLLVLPFQGMNLFLLQYRKRRVSVYNMFLSTLLQWWGLKYGHYGVSFGVLMSETLEH